MDWYKTTACHEIDKYKKELFKLSNRIWHYAESGGKAKTEDKSITCITRFLHKHNFHVTHNLHGMPLTFKAEYGVHSSPGDHKTNVAFLCRYNISGTPSQLKGNNLVTETAVAAALGVKAVLQLSCPTLGMVTVIGCPDTIKGDVATMINLKVFKDVDVVMIAMPGPRTEWCPRFLARKTFRAIYKGNVDYPCKSLPPPVDQNACLLAYQNVMAIQEHFDKGWKAQVSLGRTGHCNECETVVSTKAPSDAEIYFMEQRILPCLESAAQVSGVQYQLNIAQKTYHNFINNIELTYMLQLNAYYCGTLATPLKAKQTMEPIDVANVSHIVPTLMPMFFIGENLDIGTPEFKQALRSQKAHDNTLAMAKALAMTAVDIIATPAALCSVKENFVQALDKEKTFSFKPFRINPSSIKLLKMDMPFEGNVGWSKQP